VPVLFISIISFIAYILMEGSVSNEILAVIESVFWLYFMIFLIIEIYLTKSFKRWMKIKYEVEY